MGWLLFLIFGGTSIPFSRIVVLTYIPSQQCMTVFFFFFFLHHCQHLLSFDLSISHPSRCEVIAHCGFWLAFPLWLMIEKTQFFTLRISWLSMISSIVPGPSLPWVERKERKKSMEERKGGRKIKEERKKERKVFTLNIGLKKEWIRLGIPFGQCLFDFSNLINNQRF